jgi:hypothetical protein
MGSSADPAPDDAATWSLDVWSMVVVTLVDLVIVGVLLRFVCVRPNPRADHEGRVSTAVGTLAGCGWATVYAWTAGGLGNPRADCLVLTYGVGFLCFQLVWYLAIVLRLFRQNANQASLLQPRWAGRCIDALTPGGLAVLVLVPSAGIVGFFFVDADRSMTLVDGWCTTHSPYIEIFACLNAFILLLILWMALLQNQRSYAFRGLRARILAVFCIVFVGAVGIVVRLTTSADGAAVHRHSLFAHWVFVLAPVACVALFLATSVSWARSRNPYHRFNAGPDQYWGGNIARITLRNIHECLPIWEMFAAYAAENSPKLPHSMQALKAALYYTRTDNWTALDTPAAKTRVVAAVRIAFAACFNDAGYLIFARRDNDEIRDYAYLIVCGNTTLGTAMTDVQTARNALSNLYYRCLSALAEPFLAWKARPAVCRQLHETLNRVMTADQREAHAHTGLAITQADGRSLLDRATFGLLGHDALGLDEAGMAPPPFVAGASRQDAPPMYRNADGTLPTIAISLDARDHATPPPMEMARRVPNGTWPSVEALPARPPLAQHVDRHGTLTPADPRQAIVALAPGRARVMHRSGIPVAKQHKHAYRNHGGVDGDAAQCADDDDDWFHGIDNNPCPGADDVAISQYINAPGAAAHDVAISQYINAPGAASVGAFDPTRFADIPTIHIVRPSSPSADDDLD